MLERGIGVDDVKQAIREPDVRKSVFGNRMVVTKKIGQNTIEVVYCKQLGRHKQEAFVIITAYYLD